MKRLLAWIAGGLGAATAYRALRKRPEPAADPAEELRAKLAEMKTGSDPAGSDPAVPPDVDERRREVHEQGRAAIDELRGDGAAPESN
ncbi:MAG TPA: hypothetical protein VM690_09905 [Gaiellaceae bacterium]|nr:hypothetical protein [Gaiellaceae bacterium]